MLLTVGLYRGVCMHVLYVKHVGLPLSAHKKFVSKTKLLIQAFVNM